MKISIKSFFNLFKKKEVNKFDQILVWMIMGIVFLLPLFFISSSSYPIEFNKTFLFIFLVLITALIFFVKSFKSKKLFFSGSFIDWGIILFLLFNIISFVFSKNYYVSAVGISGFYSGSLIAVISFVLFFYLVINIIKTWASFYKIILALQISSFVIIVFNIFQVSAVYLLPWAETQNYSFNLIANSSLTLAIYSSIMILISLIIFIIAEIKWHKYFSLICLIASLILIFLLNKDWPMYFLVILIICLLIIISTKREKAPNYWTAVPAVVATLLVIFIIIDSTVLFHVQVSENILLDNPTASAIATESLSKYPLWGTGQQTFVYDFANFRPAEFNNQEFWNIQFLKSSNEWLGLFTTLGLGSTLVFVFICLKVISRICKNIYYQNQFEKKDFWKILIFFSWMIIFLASFLLPFNFILYFLNWLILGLLIVIIKIEDNQDDQLQINLDKLTIKYWGIMLGFSFTFILLLVVVIFGSQIWQSDYFYASAQRAIVAGDNEDVIFSKLEKAIDLNHFESKYYLTLAQGYSAQALAETKNYEINSPEIQAYAQQVIDNIKKAKEIDPKNPIVYETEAGVYDSLRMIIGNVDELSVKAYFKAIELEPNDPMLWLNLGRSRLLLAQEILIKNDNEDSQNEADSQLDMAISNFEQARILRKDLAIDYNIGLVYQTKGELDKSLEYYFKELNLYPDSVNLRYQIALVYEQKGEINLAIEQLNKILELDPGNQSIIEVIEKLEGSNNEDQNMESQ